MTGSRYYPNGFSIANWRPFQWTFSQTERLEQEQDHCFSFHGRSLQIVLALQRSRWVFVCLTSMYCPSRVEECDG